MPAIFISYRRSESQDVTGRIYDRLVAKYTRNEVFKDVDNIPLGVSFALHIKQVISKASVVLVIIGPGWLNAADEQGRCRLHDPNDFVRLEVETALAGGIPVIPVLVSNAAMPLANQLPGSLKKLVGRNGIQVRPDPDFNTDIARLFSGLDHLAKLLKAQPVELEPILISPKASASSSPNPAADQRSGAAQNRQPTSGTTPPRRSWLRVLLALAVLILLVGFGIGYFLQTDSGKRITKADADLGKKTTKADGPTAQKSIVGKWQAGNGQTIEFLQDGTLSYYSFSGGKKSDTRKGSYTLLDGGRLDVKAEASILFGGLWVGRWTYSVRENELILDLDVDAIKGDAEGKKSVLTFSKTRLNRVK